MLQFSQYIVRKTPDFLEDVSFEFHILITFHGPSGPTVSLELKVIGHGVAACDNATHDVSEASVASLFEIIFAEKGS